MKQEEKELLIKDLCARLPYGVMLNIEDVADKYNDKLFGLSLNHGNSLYINGLCVDNNGYDCYAKIKPYLFPLSSMTEEQAQEYKQFLEDINGYAYSIDCVPQIDWLNKNHFDYRGLIQKGLALDATGLNIY